MMIRVRISEVMARALALLAFTVVYVLADHTDDSSSEEKLEVPIIRQINKVNDDGTYTYGYEAADGSFKIETRDVLGNVKGMFGFIDESGDLKRVSYTANNETGFRNSVIHPPVPIAIRPPNTHHELGNRRPVLILKNTPTLHSTNKGPVIQHIPKKNVKDDDESSSTTISSGSSTTTEYNTSARRLPTKYNTTNSSEEDEESSSSSGRSPSANPLRKVLVSKRPVDEENSQATTMKSGKGGNNLRRQLNRALDLRGEMTHIYAGGDHRFSSPNLPAQLNALMSELRPIQVVRQAPETISYQTNDPESASQEINEVPATTTEFPAYGSRKYVVAPSPAVGSLAYIATKRQRAPPPPQEDPQYEPPDVQPHYRTQHQAQVPPPLLNVPQSPNPNYQPHPYYYEQPSLQNSLVPATLRDELMAIIFNYLQARLGPLAPPQDNLYYPPPRYHHQQLTPYINPLFAPAYPYTQPINYPPPVPYLSPYATAAATGHLPPYLPPYANPNFLYPTPAQTPPLNNPNVQFSPRKRAGPYRGPAARAIAPSPAAPIDDADLLQMLLTSPTRAPSQQRYTSSSTTERLNQNQRAPHPVRNLQIVTEATDSRQTTA